MPSLFKKSFNAHDSFSMKKSLLIKLVLTVVAFSLVLMWSFFTHDKVNAIHFATVSSKVNGIKKNKVRYSFSLGGVEYRSSYQGQRGDDAHIGDKYIVVFDSLNPENNNIIFDLRYESSAQVDSLKKNIDPKGLISWWDY